MPRPARRASGRRTARRGQASCVVRGRAADAAAGPEGAGLPFAERTSGLAAKEADGVGFGDAGHASNHMSSFIVPREVKIILAAQEVLFRPDLGAAEMMGARLGKVAARLRFVGIDGEEMRGIRDFAAVGWHQYIVRYEWPAAEEQRGPLGHRAGDTLASRR